MSASVRRFRAALSMTSKSVEAGLMTRVSSSLTRPLLVLISRSAWSVKDNQLAARLFDATLVHIFRKIGCSNNTL